MKPAFWARRAHKWIGLVIGVQALLWMLSGVYMTGCQLKFACAAAKACIRAP